MKLKLPVVFMAVLLVLSLMISGQVDLKAQSIYVGEEPQQVEDEFIYEPEGITVESWVEDLEVPWQLTFLPESDRALVTERPGRVRLIEDGDLVDEYYADPPAVHTAEGGMMGMDHHPDFPAEPYIYIMYTYEADDGNLYSRITRLVDRGRYAEDEEVIFDGIPAAENHNGGRIMFGPDEKLYVTTGDVWDRQLSQEPDSLAGKILRINADGTIPEDNPDPDSPVYSLGHRNPQGLAWNDRDHLFISDHGPSGEESLQAKDMVKVIQPGGNYGWPERIGYFGDGEFLDPLVMWSEDAVPPAGTEIVGDDLFIATLRSRALIRISLEHHGGYDYEVTSIERWFGQDDYSGRYGRLRDVNLGPDGALYVMSSNRDGRGSPLPGDDKIYRIEIEELQSN